VNDLWFLNELTREHYADRLRDAEIARRFWHVRSAGRPQSIWKSLLTVFSAFF
jgi:hypothetical protein